jgi:ribonuclease D
MTNDEGNRKAKSTKSRYGDESHSDFVVPSTLDIRHSSLSAGPISHPQQLRELLPHLQLFQRIAVDTEADSLHSYREKLCLLQISVPDGDFIVDPLADLDFAPLRTVLEQKELVLHGADYDLRMLRRGLNFTAHEVFDTVIAARLLGIRQFSLAALVKSYFQIDLPKGSQKANWAQRPLPRRMTEYAINDTRYLLPLAEKLEAELRQRNRLDWFRQSCRRAIEQAGIERDRNEDDLWRIRGAGTLHGRSGAVLRALWQWRENEAAVADRPSFHILQNHELISSAEKFAAGETPDYRHFSERRRHAFREAAKQALQLPEKDWPIWQRRTGTRPSAETVRRSDQLRQRRDHAAKELKIEPAFVASRGALESIAADKARAEKLLVPWQREVLGL